MATGSGVSAVDAESLATSELGRQLATLSLAVSGPVAAGQAAQAVACRNVMARLGLDVPLVAVADFAHVLGGGAVPETPPVLRELSDRKVAEKLARYAQVLRALGATPTVENIARRAFSQELMGVLLARLLGDAHRQWSGARPFTIVRGDLPVASGLYAVAARELAQRYDPGWCLGFVGQLAQSRELLIARAEQLDIGPLRLLGLFPASAQPDLLDLYRLISTPAAGRAVDVSLQLLPSILETKRQTSAQRFVIDGYASVEKRGSVDAILPSELAHDSDVFAQKVLTDELLYYGHERQQQSVVREHWILIDASASMRGVREVLARGLAIALGKKLQLSGDTVSLRFFDSRLHRRIPLGAASGHELPHLLCFRSERGRNYGRVFEDLAVEARRAQRRGSRTLAITFLTHGECHVPASTMDALSQAARLYGIFVLPSRPLALAYLGTLARYQVVTEDDFRAQESRGSRALAIVEDVASAGLRDPRVRRAT
jgi:hypothetical protein